MSQNPWSERAQDWADVFEGWNGWGVPVYRRVLERVGVDTSSTVLDVGCGAGRFCRMARDRGAAVSGLDATPEFVKIAQSRVHDGDFRVGDMLKVPWPDDSFDLVTGFNSFFIADDMVAAVAEARRVARPGGHVATTVFGRPERCHSTAMFAAVQSLDGGATPRAGDGPKLHEGGVLEEVASDAGLTVLEADFLAYEETFPDLDTMLRGVLAPPPMRRAAAAHGEETVREAIAAALADQVEPDGRVVLREEVRYLVAKA